LKILAVAGMEGSNPSHTPMENRLKLSKSSTAPLVDSTKYRIIVGALRYLVNTRPDLAYVVGYISRFMEKPTVEHLMAVKSVLRYIAGTTDLNCHFGRKRKTSELISYSDSNLARDVDTRQSTTRVLFFLGDSLITWLSQKQRVVALSSCEARYVGATTAACQGIWLGRLLAEFQGEVEANPFAMKIDNQSTIQLSCNPVFHDHSKHIDNKYHFIRQCIEEDRVRVVHVDTTNQLADILMKSLGRDHFIELHTRPGLIKVQEERQA
jgi:hypothetical protein